MPQDNVLSLNAFGEIIEPKGKRKYPDVPPTPSQETPTIVPLKRVTPEETPEETPDVIPPGEESPASIPPEEKAEVKGGRFSRGSDQSNCVSSKVLMWLVQTKLLHWQTQSEPEHKALNKLFENLNDLGDELVESVMGKYGRPELSQEDCHLVLTNYINPDSPDGLPEFIENIDRCFREECSPIFPVEKDPEIHNLIQEILGKIDKISYLLTLRK